MTQTMELYERDTKEAIFKMLEKPFMNILKEMEE